MDQNQPVLQSTDVTQKLVEALPNLKLKGFTESKIIFTYPIMLESSSVAPSASNNTSVFNRRSPPYVLVYPIQ